MPRLFRVGVKAHEETIVSVASEPPAIQIKFGKASVRDDLKYMQDRTVQAAPIDFKPGDGLRLRLFLDRSVLEVFVGDQRYLAQRIYPTHPETLGVKHFSRGGPTFVRYLRAREMAAANP